MCSSQSRNVKPTLSSLDKPQTHLRLSHYSGHSLSLHLREWRFPNLMSYCYWHIDHSLSHWRCQLLYPPRQKRSSDFVSSFSQPANRFLSGIKRLSESWPCIKFCGFIKMIINCLSSLLALWFVGREFASIRHTCSTGTNLWLRECSSRHKNLMGNLAGLWAPVLALVIMKRCSILGLVPLNHHFV